MLKYLMLHLSDALKMRCHERSFPNTAFVISCICPMHFNRIATGRNGHGLSDLAVASARYTQTALLRESEEECTSGRRCICPMHSNCIATWKESADVRVHQVASARCTVMALL